MIGSTRTFVVGDIHGCLHELQALLRKAGVQPRDHLISVGDLVDRGPESVGVYDLLCNRPNTVCVLGNHEDKLIRGRTEGLKQATSQRITRVQFGDRLDELLDWLETLPLFHWINAETIVVHAGYLGDSSDRRMLLRGMRPQDKPFTSKFRWRRHCRGDVTVLYGHHTIRRVNPKGKLINLDTACVHGGRLSGIWLPDRRVVSVGASRDYWAMESRQWKQAQRCGNLELFRSRVRKGTLSSYSTRELEVLSLDLEAEDMEDVAGRDEVMPALEKARTMMVECSRFIRSIAAEIDAEVAEFFGEDIQGVDRRRMPSVVEFIREKTTIPPSFVLIAARGADNALERRLEVLKLSEIRRVMHSRVW